MPLFIFHVVPRRMHLNFNGNGPGANGEKDHLSSKYLEIFEPFFYIHNSALFWLPGMLVTSTFKNFQAFLSSGTILSSQFSFISFLMSGLFLQLCFL